MALVCVRVCVTVDELFLAKRLIWFLTHQPLATRAGIAAYLAEFGDPTEDAPPAEPVVVETKEERKARKAAAAKVGPRRCRSPHHRTPPCDVARKRPCE